MLTKFTAVLFAICMSTGAAYAWRASSSLTHAHFPTCAEGLVKTMCVCRAEHARGRQQLCRTGRYCHILDGVCRD